MKYNNMSMEQVSERLADVTRSLFEKDRYKEYLKFIQKFPSYSERNLTMLLDQDPTCTMVAGYSDWARYKRHVVKGAKGLKIIRPIRKNIWVDKKDVLGNTVCDANGKPLKEKKLIVTGYRLGTVFDISQTAGKPVPSVTTLFSDRIDGYTELLDILKAISPAPIIFDPDSEEGFSIEAEKISVRSGLSQQQTLQNLLPSIASAYLYKETGDCYDMGSLEAESCAYITANRFGLDKDFAFDYIADYSDGKSLDELYDTLKLIRTVSSTILKDITDATKALNIA